ncbi:hypothetical protein [Paraglaciecola sp.]|uniref:hypothetical protein n=1 Tax=Paraglaciecola sp. TaxID=1920173 RepID=UPI003EFB3863
MSIPKEFFDMLPLPIVVVKNTPDTLNHPLIFVNTRFSEVIGWDLDEIPDKDHWWHKAYPDPHYQKAIENLWELKMESLTPANDSFVIMAVNIMTKFQGIKRFKVYTELKSVLMEGYYVVAMEEIEDGVQIPE